MTLMEREGRRIPGSGHMHQTPWHIWYRRNKKHYLQNAYSSCLNALRTLQSRVL